MRKSLECLHLRLTTGQPNITDTDRKSLNILAKFRKNTAEGRDKRLINAGQFVSEILLDFQRVKKTRIPIPSNRTVLNA
ncbi:MAG: hypothetical protein CMJ47_04360 [Planctomyces sp.]|nr:hypothetical protein [Planctomyces sp.]